MARMRMFALLIFCLGFSFFWMTEASALCCACQKSGTGLCVNFSDLVSCGNYQRSSAYQTLDTTLRTGLSCEPTALNAQACQLRPASGAGTGRCAFAPIADTALATTLRGLSSPVPASPTTAGTAQTCCLCHKGTQNLCVNFSGLSSCAQAGQHASVSAIRSRNASLVEGFACETLQIDQCRIQGSGSNPGPGRCPSTPLASGGLEAALQQNASPGTTTTPTTTARIREPSAPIIPALNVPIPGLQFSIPQTTDNKLCFSWLAQYIIAIYRYVLSISTVIATVMIVYGGFRYLAGSAFSDVQVGKTIIKDAVLGLLIAYGAFILLYTINPETLALSPLCVSQVTFEGSQYESVEETPQQIQAQGGRTASCNGRGPQRHTPNASCTFYTASQQPLTHVEGNVPIEACQNALKQSRILVPARSIIPCGPGQKARGGCGSYINHNVGELLRRTLDQLPSGNYIFIDGIFRESHSQGGIFLLSAATCGPFTNNGGDMPRHEWSSACDFGGHAAGVSMDIGFNHEGLDRVRDISTRVIGDPQNRTFEKWMLDHGWHRFCAETWHYDPGSGSLCADNPDRGTAATP